MCKVIEKTAFVDTKVIAESKRFLALTVDMTNDTPAIAKQFEVLNPPGLVFIGGNGAPRKELHLINKEVGAERLLSALKKVT